MVRKFNDYLKRVFSYLRNYIDDGTVLTTKFIIVSRIRTNTEIYNILNSEVEILNNLSKELYNDDKYKILFICINSITSNFHINTKEYIEDTITEDMDKIFIIPTSNDRLEFFYSRLIKDHIFDDYERINPIKIEIIKKLYKNYNKNVIKYFYKEI